MDVYFLILPNIHLMDLSGPAQALADCNELQGEQFRCHYISHQQTVSSWQGLALSTMSALPEVVQPGSLIYIPGMKLSAGKIDPGLNQEVLDWLQEMDRQNARLIGVCTGSFILGAAGLLDGRKCTTHHRQLRRLAEEFPNAEVLQERMFVEDQGLYTSAGVSAGIDLTLHLITEIVGPDAGVAVAREMVVCSRRMGDDPQIAPQFLYRDHVHPTIHEAQDIIASKLNRPLTAESVARQLNISARHFQRLFRQATGVTFKQYVNEQRIQKADQLLKSTNHSIEWVAELAGFQSTKTFRDAWGRKFDYPPSQRRTSSRNDNQAGAQQS
ncbi:GlxA family transcriptional regulator [Marinobacter sp. HN1S83]|uniref:GlxA family transcriptional regulator n=1 Tax=Marinobacter sp. HN1S83 TaxID=3382301 RepID=UPI00387B9474